MYNIKTLNKIAAVGLGALPRDSFTVDADAPADAVLVRSASMHGQPLPPSLLCVARAGAGVNNIPVELCSEQGVVVFNTPGANANAVKELTLCALLLASRDIAGGLAWAATLKGKGAEVPALVEKGKGAFAGPELYKKTLGVVGLGATGALVANAALALGMKVIGHDPYLSVESAWRVDRHIENCPDYKSVFERGDYITLHAPATAETKGLICAAAIAQMKDGVRLINIARGDLVNETDLLAALASGKVARYVTDFPGDALLGEKNVVALPHLGASTPESEDNCAVMACEQVKNYLLYGAVKNSVNLPDIDQPLASGHRLCVLHRNIPNMLGTVSSALAAEGINIENMVSKSKKDYAYTVLDIDGHPAAPIKAEGIIRVRHLKI
ncbi:MAG: phosphoglycerate dehydrogenase [Oscillospiraceae bacterium]|jgi:D-3-phosphoglycerate dehydrogenase|nr:phosphoglycerate dehydrogenase [Oscillospiraceae bacterium]